MESSYRKIRREAAAKFQSDFGFEFNLGATVSAPVTAAEDVVNAVKAAMPTPIQDLINKAKGTLDDAALNRLKDFSNTDTGKMLLRAGATGVFYTLAISGVPFIIASGFWAIPGLLCGEPFDQAFITEFAWRVETTGEILGADIKDAWSKEIGRLVPAIKNEVNSGILDKPISEVAKRFNAREDITAYAMSLVKRSLDWISGLFFDPKTGKQISAIEARSKTTTRPRPAVVTKYLQLEKASKSSTQARSGPLFLKQDNKSSMLSKLAGSGTGQRGSSDTEKPIQDAPLVIQKSNLPYVVAGAGIGGAAALAAGMAMPIVGLAALAGGAALSLLKK